MTFINSKTDLELYMKRTERQKEVLQLSTLFDDIEKEQLKECFEEIIMLCKIKMLDKNRIVKS